MANINISIKQGSLKKLKFTVTEQDSENSVNLTGTILTFTVKDSKLDTNAAITKVDIDFDKGEQANGIVYVTINATDTASLESGDYIGELMIKWSSANIIKSNDVDVIIEQAVD